MEEKSANFMFCLSYPYYTPPNYSRPIPTDTMDRHDIPALDLPQKKIGAFWAASPAVRPWTRREAVLPLPMRRRRDGCRRRRTMGATTHPGMMLPPRVIALLTVHEHAVSTDRCPSAAAVQDDVPGEGIDGDSEHRA